MHKYQNIERNFENAYYWHEFIFKKPRRTATGELNYSMVGYDVIYQGKTPKDLMYYMLTNFFLKQVRLFAKTNQIKTILIYKKEFHKLKTDTLIAELEVFDNRTIQPAIIKTTYANEFEWIKSHYDKVEYDAKQRLIQADLNKRIEWCKQIFFEWCKMFLGQNENVSLENIEKMKLVILSTDKEEKEATKRQHYGTVITELHQDSWWKTQEPHKLLREAEFRQSCMVFNSLILQKMKTIERNDLQKTISGKT